MTLALVCTLALAQTGQAAPPPRSSTASPSPLDRPAAASAPIPGGLMDVPPPVDCDRHVTRAELRADWHHVATAADRDRLRTWRESWQSAIDKARAGGGAGAIAGNAALFDADRAQPDAALPPPGAYRCRTYKLGANGPAAKDFTAYPALACRVSAAGRVARLIVTEGAQRPIGTLYPDGPARAVFLGTLELGDETIPIGYGVDGTRDMAGFVERIGPKRWRLTLPAPRFESLTDVMEIVPG